MFKVLIVAVLGVAVGLLVTNYSGSDEPAVGSHTASTPSASTTAGSSADYKPKGTVSERFIQFLNHVMNVDTSFITMRTDPTRRPYFTPHHFYAASDASDFDLVLKLPAGAQFNQVTMNTTLGAVLFELYKQLDKDKRPAPEAIDFLPTVFSLLYERQVLQKSSRWWPWLETLPKPSERLANGIHFTEEEVGCLHPEAREQVNKMRTDVDNAMEFAKVICASKYKEFCFTRGEVEWAYGVVSQRAMNFTGHVTLIPVIDAMPYSVSPTVMPGMLHTTKEGDSVAVDFVSRGHMKKGELLTFREGFKYPSTVLVRQGFHDDALFDDGTPLWVQYDEENNARLLEMNCSTHPDGLIMKKDANVHELVVQCAQLHVIRGEESVAERAKYDFNLIEIIDGGYEFLLNHADLALASFPTEEKNPQCFSKKTRILREIEAHNKKYIQMFRTFKQRVSHKRQQEKVMNKLWDKAVEDEVGTKQIMAQFGDDGSLLEYNKDQPKGVESGSTADGAATEEGEMAKEDEKSSDDSAGSS